MNKQRKVLIIITYNEMGIIIDTKTEELGSSAQPTFDARDTQYNLPIGTDLISRAAATDALRKMQTYKLFSGDDMLLIDQAGAQTELMLLPSRTPIQELLDVTADRDYWKAQCHVYEQEIERIKPKTGKWILDRSGAYCCSECMEPCAGYVMMKPRDKFCKMCGSINEVTE